MKNIYSEKNVNKVIKPCNERSCPCNEGKGCQANIFCKETCDKAVADENSEWHVLLNNASAALNTSGYDEACKAIYEFAERI